MPADTLTTEFCLRLSRAWATLSRRLDKIGRASCRERV